MSLICPFFLGLWWGKKAFISDDDVLRYEKLQRQDKEYVHGQLGVEAAKIKGIFHDDVKGWDVHDEHEVTSPAEDVETRLQQWRSQLEQSSLSTSNPDPISNFEEHPCEAGVIPISDLCQEEIDDGMSRRVDDECMVDTIQNEIDQLNDDQRRAFDIVDWHLNETISGKKPPQLLMVIPGEGGVGKSKVIQTITQNFRRRNRVDWLVKGAYTGIAASLIDGKTLHVLAGIPVRGGKQSAQTLQKLRDFWHIKRYFIIDEMSMLSRVFWAKLSRVISIAKEVIGEEIFGGLNVLVAGDFHQFPPVVARQSAPLYWPIDSRRDSEDEILGRKIFEQFTTVVQLKKQIRVQDPEWHDLLQHVRYGNCLQRHIDALRKLIITDPACPHTDYDSPPWNEARLVTPRHSVRLQWNSAAIRKHCGQNNRRLYICPAQDSIEGRSVTNEEKIAILTRTRGSNSQMDRGGLGKEIELAIGASVMVTLNIHTDLDVANGVRGTIQGIILDERERLITTSDTRTIRLQYPPRYVLVKLARTKAPHLEGLDENVIPIEPVMKSFSIVKDGRKITVNRTQLPLTLAYAFTDHRAQGQTLEPVIVDIGPPPHGSLTPFNIYVALSRGTRAKNIRLLRDFDEKLLQRHPSEYLRLEDERLEKLDEKTRQLWERREEYNTMYSIL